MASSSLDELTSMAESTSYHPVTIIDGATKEGATATKSAAAVSKPGIWTRVTNRLPFLQTKRGVAVTTIAILVIIGGGLAGLAALRNRNGGGGSGSGGSGGTSNPNTITSDAHFYGLSPPVYPSREFPPYQFDNGLVSGSDIFITDTIGLANTTGTGTWAQSFQRAQAMVANMTLDEKVRMKVHRMICVVFV